MVDEDELTYEDMLQSLGDIVASQEPVQLLIARQEGPVIAALGGRLQPVPDAFAQQARAMFRDDDLTVFYVHGGQQHERLPYFVMSPSLFETAEAVTEDALEAAGGQFWRGLTIFSGGLALNIGVERRKGD